MTTQTGKAAETEDAVMSDETDETAVRPEFQPFPKIARLFRDVVVTEKIDGTNAAVGITEDGLIYAQSRKRLITPDDDNFGFARWVAANAGALSATLGVGLHFGEWWGSGIQRTYGLPNGDKRFSLFNVHRWEDEDLSLVLGLRVVPVLYRGPFNLAAITACLDNLALHGSQAAIGFPKPEGVVIFHTASQDIYKATIERDEEPKSTASRS